MKYAVTDREGAILIIKADSREEAAQDYCDGCAWGQDDGTVWIDVWVTDCDEKGNPYETDRYGNDGNGIERTAMFTIGIDPPEPDCTHDDGHDWRQPEWLGGCKENPGVWASGGGAKGTDVCARCGIYRDWDNWAQRSDTGEQGLNSIAYRDADEQSEEWADELQREANIDAEPEPMFTNADGELGCILPYRATKEKWVEYLRNYPEWYKEYTDHLKYLADGPITLPTMDEWIEEQIDEHLEPWDGDLEIDKL